MPENDWSQQCNECSEKFGKGYDECPYCGSEDIGE
jgi:rRNA maturation endonuclease Nob1